MEKDKSTNPQILHKQNFKMRLNDIQIKKIVNLAKENFGDDIKLFLFGSRANDSLKGGDIDLMLETNEHIDMKIKIEFLSKIFKYITERKIDLIIFDRTSIKSEIYKIAKKDGIAIC